MSEQIYFFNRQQQLIKILQETELIESIQEKEITADKSELMNDTLSVVVHYDEAIKDASYMAVRELDQSFSIYRIIFISDPENQLSFIGVHFAADELDGYIVTEVVAENRPIKEVIEKLLAGTDWQVRYVDPLLKRISGSFTYLSVKEALKQLQAEGCEILFKSQVSGQGITEKWLEVYQQIGEISQERFTYGDKALKVVKEQDRSNVYTSLIGRGKGEEVGDGTGRRVDFSKIEWKKSSGNPLDKPKGQIWLEFPEMTAEYGIPSKNGKMRKREKVVVFDQVDQPEELLKYTYEALLESSRPLVQFKTEILGGDAIGNTVSIHRFDRDYHYRVRVFKNKLDRLTGKTESELGDNLSKSASRDASSIRNNLQKLDESKMTFYDSEEISKWQTDIIRGAKGGSIIMMNGIETGQSDSREPYQMVWMNKDSLENSDHFLVANSDGIGFIKGDFKKSELHTAWSIDGKFNADYINTGTLSAINIKGVNIEGSNIKGTNIKGGKITGSTIETEGDSHQIRMKNGMIMFRRDDKKDIGSLTATYGGGVANGLAIIQGENEIFSLNTPNPGGAGGSNYVLQIPKESNNKNPMVNSRGRWRHDGNLEISGKLLINGQEVFPGGSGGGTNPPELSTEQEKNAWAIWQFFKGKGWTEESIAGMLGNMESESNIMPDIHEISGGGGYGLTQWTPKEKLVDWCVQQGLDYRTLNAQCQRIQWEMLNNQQWFANPQRPDLSYISFSNFTKLKDTKQAAEYFIAFYEHPEFPNQPNRGIQAEKWYRKFHDLGSTSGYVVPIDGPYSITSEYGWRDNPTGSGQQLHKGIDLVNGNAQASIYAANAGEVIYAQWNSGGYGNCVMVKHSDGWITAYNHMSVIKVQVGQKVSQRQAVGIIGTTGDSTGIHLHFEVKKDLWSGHVNPREILKF